MFWPRQYIQSISWFRSMHVTLRKKLAPMKARRASLQAAN
jgi:hypothetical protein